MATDKLIIIGRLGRPRGLSGETHVTVETDFPDRFLGLKEVLVQTTKGWQPYRLASTRLVSGRPVLRFDGITTREDAARMTNMELAVPRAEAVELPPGTFYVFDLIGCRVETEGTKRMIGHVTDVERYPANDVYVIEDDSGKKTRCPVVKQYIRHVDIDSRRIIIDPTGLMEE